MTQVYETRHEWLTARSKGIGGSEVSDLLGIGYGTPYSLWERKTGRAADIPDNPHMRAGRYLESAVAKMFEDETGFALTGDGNVLYHHPDHPELIGSPDRLIHTKQGIGVLEIKTTQRKVDADNLPVTWFTQLQWYMGISGYYGFGHIAWLISGVEFGHVRVEFNREYFEDIKQQALDFWHNHVLADVPPPPIRRSDIERIYQVSRPGAVDGGMMAMDVYRKVKANKEKIKELTEANDELLESVVIALGEKETLTCGSQVLFTYKTQTRREIDTKALETEHHEMIQPYIREKSSRVLRLK